MVGHFLGKTRSEIETTMTWPDLQALLAHWHHEPPIAWMLARYFEIEERQYESDEMSQESAESLFTSMFAAVAAGGKTF